MKFSKLKTLFEKNITLLENSLIVYEKLRVLLFRIGVFALFYNIFSITIKYFFVVPISLQWILTSISIIVSLVIIHLLIYILRTKYELNEITDNFNGLMETARYSLSDDDFSILSKSVNFNLKQIDNKKFKSGF